MKKILLLLVILLTLPFSLRPCDIDGIREGVRLGMKDYYNSELEKTLVTSPWTPATREVRDSTAYAQWDAWEAPDTTTHLDMWGRTPAEVLADDIWAPDWNVGWVPDCKALRYYYEHTIKPEIEVQDFSDGLRGNVNTVPIIENILRIRDSIDQHWRDSITTIQAELLWNTPLKKNETMEIYKLLRNLEED